MNDREAVDMMRRCKGEILHLRAEIDRLAPKAHAYDSIAEILRLLPKPSVGNGQDLAWILDRRINELDAHATPPSAAPIEPTEE